MAAHPPDLYLAACGKNNKASNRLNPEGQTKYLAYKRHCEKAENNIVSDKGITVNSTPYIRNNYIRDLKEAREKWNNCKKGRVNFRKKCINPKYINVPEDTHALPIKDARDKMVDLQRRITNFENDVKQNANKQRGVQFENTAATTAAADEINIEDLYDIKDNKLELNSEFTNKKSKAILRVYIEKIIREAAVQGRPPILSPDELNEVTVRDHGDAYKNLIRKMLIRKIILEEFGTYSMAREHLDNERGASGGGGGGIAGFRGLSAGVIDGAMPPPLELSSLAWHPPPPASADARTRRRHRRTRNKRRAERAFEWTRNVNAVSDNESGRGSSRSSRSSQSSTRRGRSTSTRRGSTRRGRSTSTRRGSTRRNSRSRSRSSRSTRRSSRSTGTRRSRSSSRGAAENG